MQTISFLTLSLLSYTIIRLLTDISKAEKLYISLNSGEKKEREFMRVTILGRMRDLQCI